MTGNLRVLALLMALAVPVASTGGCATVAGTVVSPVTGGIDLTRQFLKPRDNRGKWYFVPFVFLGGAIAGPVVAIYNGVGHDASIFSGWHRYWRDFHKIFKPFEMISR